jgi:hypothetical protein
VKRKAQLINKFDSLVLKIGDKVITDASETGKIVALGSAEQLIDQDYDSDNYASESTRYGEFTKKEPCAAIQIKKETFVIPQKNVKKI